MSSEDLAFESNEVGAGDSAGYGLEEDKDNDSYAEELFELEYLSCSGASFESDFEDDEIDDDDGIDLESLPFPERLNIRRKSTVSLIRDAVTKNAKPEQLTKPFGELMKMNVPLENKIPALPLLSKGIVLTRGNIGQNLLRPLKTYITEDPLNQEKVVGEPYNALHDPCAKNYFANPSVRRLLVKQGLMTEAGQVVCNLTEFNNFRRYMNKAVCAEDVREEFEKYGKQREQGHKLLGQARPPTTLDQRIEKAKQMAQQIKNEHFEKFKESQKMKAERMQRCQLELERKRINNLLKAQTKERTRIQKIQKIKNYEINARAQKIHFIEAKEKSVIVKKKNDSTKKEQNEMDFLEKRIQVLEERESKRQQLERELREELRRSNELRQKQLENYRAKLPYRMKPQLKEEPKPNLRELHKKYEKKWNNYNKKKLLQSQKAPSGPSASVSHTATSMQKLIWDLKNQISDEDEEEVTDTDEFDFEAYQD